MNKNFFQNSPIVVANTKSYIKNIKDFYTLQNKIWELIEKDTVKYFCAVPSALISQIAKEEYKALIVGAQNFENLEIGPYTGGNTLENIVDAGAKFVILGHSETRKNLKYNNEDVNERVKKSIQKKLMTILCVGEENREKEDEYAYIDEIKSELQQNLKNIDRKNINKLIVAYEPLWAIGAPTAATGEQVQEAIIVIRRTLVDMFGIEHAKKIKILYGGSVTEYNAKKFIEEATADGVLIGRASMNAKSFAGIVNNILY